ncbi:MAG TPA: hypothetical protein VGB55_01070 [Tepidisphaeraceae bacterium]
MAQRAHSHAAPVEPLGMEYGLIVAGLALLLLMFFLSGPQNLWQHYLTSVPIVINDFSTGSTIPYPESAIFLTDVGATAFLLLLFLDGIISGLSRSTGGRYFIVAAAALVVALNVYVFLRTKPIIGPQLFNAIAVLVSLVLLISAIRSLKADRIAAAQ